MVAARFAVGPKSPPVSLTLVMMALAAALSSGCDDSSTTGLEPPDVPPPSRTSPEELLSVYMENAFASRDSIAVVAMLHEEFSCYTLLEVEDADSLRDILGSDDWFDDFCGRTLYLQAVGSLFRDSTVIGITLDVQVIGDLPSTDDGCPDCRQVETTSTVRLAEVGDGDEPVIFTIDVPVTFYVTRDPRDSQQWVLWKQISRSSWRLWEFPSSPGGLTAAP